MFPSLNGEPLSKALEEPIDFFQKMKEGNKIFIEFFSVIRIAMPNACVIKIFRFFLKLLGWALNA